MTFVIEQYWIYSENETYYVAQVYLPVVGSATNTLSLGHNDCNNPTRPPTMNIATDRKIIDVLEGMQLEWTMHVKEAKNHGFPDRTKRYFELIYRKEDKDRVVHRSVEDILEGYNPNMMLSIYHTQN
ncbi:hypothetical protein K2173_021363 [Erythroxylum novogranatense]|uniref:AAA-type ATPase N-terminal domain-containing protein n=1 Tax=Erythroxylum novogranatense TaxID=1862640 RepID=A0AAV8TW40_9ROSI|nr:hypothetical protein K2173_021363 [Erythroxylum novogranatense]